MLSVALLEGVFGSVPTSAAKRALLERCFRAEGSTSMSISNQLPVLVQDPGVIVNPFTFLVANSSRIHR